MDIFLIRREKEVRKNDNFLVIRGEKNKLQASAIYTKVAALHSKPMPPFLTNSQNFQDLATRQLDMTN